MKTYLLVTCLLPFSLVGQSLTPLQIKHKTLEILKKYDTDAHKIVNDYLTSPNGYKLKNSTISLGKPHDITVYISDKTEKGIIESINTVVHETNHGYTSRLAYKALSTLNPDNFSFGQEYYLYYINTTEQILVKHTKTFPSRDLVGIIPQNLRTLRFDTYISKAPDMQSTQQSGIYGLLDEMNSYLLGTQTAVRLYDYYLNEKKAKGQDWLDYLKEVEGTLFAYQEFKFYILKYLLYARDKETAIFNNILLNKDFCKAFLKIESLFNQLCKDYYNRRSQLLESLKKQGFSVRIEDEFIYIGNRGIGHFQSVFQLLQTETSKPEYQAIMKRLSE